MNTFCSYYNLGICKSCTRIEESYETQLQKKSDQLIKLLEINSRIHLVPPTPSRSQAFRNKAKFAVTGTLDSPIIGLTGTAELDQGREILDCPLHHPEINKVIKDLPDFIRLARLTPYRIKEKNGELKGVIVYYSQESAQMYLRFVLRSKESLDRIKKHFSSLVNLHPILSCVSANIQPLAHAVLEGEEEIFFTEENFIQHQLSQVTMGLHPQGFVQTNQEVALQLYQTAKAWVKELHPDTFVELFSGQGAFSFFIQDDVKKAVGIEINQEAVMRANQSAQDQNMPHLKFVARDVTTMEQEAIQLKPDVILVNPPRRGLGKASELIRAIRAPYFIYSSCNALSLKEDLDKLKDLYQVQKLQLFDMFPHTEHFETLVLLKLIKLPDYNGVRDFLKSS